MLAHVVAQSVDVVCIGDDHPCPHVMEAGTPHALYAVGAATVADANGGPDVAAALRTGRVTRG